MKNTLEVKELLQKAVDAICKSEHYEQEMCLIAQHIGLQGEKRRMRYESVKCHIMINYLRCDAYDSYCIELAYNDCKVDTGHITNFEEYFEATLAYFSNKYDALHNIANKLVLANAKPYAEKLYKMCACIMDDIKYFQRTIKEGHIAKWDPSWMLLHETTDYNVHDEFEKKEKALGWDC